jgi:hypothetical protein
MSRPSALQIELFRAMEDVQEMADATVVLLVDADGRSVAVSGDEADVPGPLRAALSGKRLAEAGSVVALLSSVNGELSETRLNVSIYDASHGYVLAILFDADADLATVQSVGRDACTMLAALFDASAG